MRTSSTASPPWRVSVIINNSLTELDADIFDGLTALKNLDIIIIGTGLTELDADIFDGLTALERLQISSNGLTELDADIFDGLTALERLSFFQNSLTELDADIFDGLTALERLHINGNLLTTLPDGIFNDQTALQVLRLQCNFLTELDLGLFDPFASTLTDLDIRINDFTTPPSESAIRARLTSLTDLWTDLFSANERPPGCLPRESPLLSVTVLPASLTVAEGGTVMYTAAMNTQPTADVDVLIASDNADVTALPDRLTFTMDS